MGVRTRGVAFAISVGLIGWLALASASGAPARGDVIQSHIHVYSDGLNVTVNVTELGSAFDQRFFVAGGITVESMLENHGVSAAGECTLLNDYEATCPPALGVTVRGGAKDDDIGFGFTDEEALSTTVRGLGGDDDLDGWLSYIPDEIYGGPGDDSINGGLGRDLIDGGPGAHDAADYGLINREVPVRVTANEGAGNDGSSEDGPPGSRDTVVDIESVYGTILGDYLSNGDASGILHGAGLVARDDYGNDRLIGGSGRDRLMGHEGDDLLRGGSDADSFHGGRGDDAVRARDRSGDNRINCGDGNRDDAVLDHALDPRPRNCEESRRA
jgi:Ca2+-binding RTX toxin-like protein